jgi:hypothetical protein
MTDTATAAEQDEGDSLTGHDDNEVLERNCVSSSYVYVFIFIFYLLY